MYAVGLALCTFANIASEEMSRDLANEIEKLLGSSNTYIRKKVGPSAIVQRIPLIILSRLRFARSGFLRKFLISVIISSPKPRIFLQIETTESF
jgi:hypothetical protein